MTPQYEEAVNVFNGFLEAWPDHSLASEVMVALAYTLDKAGRREEAIAWIDRFERDCPTRESIVRSMRYRIQGLKMETPSPDSD